MAKSSKDITSFEGGLINAVEPSDSGEENGMYNVENLEGLYKKGVLVPSGTIEERTNSIAQLGGNLQFSGCGYGIMQSDWEYLPERVIHFTFLHDDPSEENYMRINDGALTGDFNDWEYESGDGTHPYWFGSGGAGLMMCNWAGASSNDGHGKIGGFRIPHDINGNTNSAGDSNLFEPNTLYRITVQSFLTDNSANYNTIHGLNPAFHYHNSIMRHGPLVGHKYIAPLHKEPTVGSPGDFVWETMWGNYGKPVQCLDNLGASSDFKTYYMVTKGIVGSKELHFGAYFDAHCVISSSDRMVGLKTITIDIAEKYNGTQYYFHAKDDGGVNIHQDEGTSVIDYMYVQNSGVDGNDPNYLFSSNVARIQGTNFADYANIIAPKWFGMIRRNYFRDVIDYTTDNENGIQQGQYGTGLINAAMTPIKADNTQTSDNWNYGWTDDDNYITAKVPFQFETKLHGWETEPTTLTPPDPLYCTLVNVNDIEQIIEGTIAQTPWYSSGTDSGAWFGMDLMSGDGTYHKHFDLGTQGYLLRLEYYVDKKEAIPGDPKAEDITGTWNEAEDTETPAAAGELDIVYRFYCTFVYDLGAQESTMTRIQLCTEAGALKPLGGGTNLAMPDMYINSDDTFLRDEIQLKGFNSDIYATDPQLMHDTRLTFRPMIIPGAMGMHGWNLPKRCSGVNWYYSTDKDNHTSRWKLIETDFIKGVKPHSSANAAHLPWQLLRYAWAGFYDSEPENNATSMQNKSRIAGGAMKNRYPHHQGLSHSNDADMSGLAKFLQFDDPPKFEDWNSIYGSSPDETDDIYYKTATIIGSQAFYGNVLINGESYRDRILVSIANHGYDMIPFDNYLDVAAGDGDEIVSLLTHNEQLYVFKKRSLQVVSVGEDSDETVATSAIGGIDNKHHAIATNIGIIWANEYGVFLHGDGQVENLIQGKVNDFGLNNSDRFVVGYSPRYNRVFIMSSTEKNTAKTIHMIDTNDKTWWRSTGQAETAMDYSNFGLDKDMKLTFLKNLQDVSGYGVSRMEWNPASEAQNVLFEVGDLNLEGVTSKKQLYSIVTVSKNASSLSIAAQQTAVDGSKTTINLTPPTLSGSTTGYGKVEHVVQADTAEDLLFANATISGTSSADMEIHSVSFIYRDKGVK